MYWVDRQKIYLCKEYGKGLNIGFIQNLQIGIKERLMSNKFNDWNKYRFFWLIYLCINFDDIQTVLCVRDGEGGREKRFMDYNIFTTMLEL